MLGWRWSPCLRLRLQLLLLLLLFIVSPSLVSGYHSCASYRSCKDCNDASFCHWCDHDQDHNNRTSNHSPSAVGGTGTGTGTGGACHVMGSYYGCLSGSHCDAQPSPPMPPNSDSCASHSDSCKACTLASHMCHWCTHDNACHTIGSVHGCAIGVDCFSNDRCRRRASEPIQHIVFTDMGWGPFCVAFAIAALMCAGVGVCSCIESHLAGAYEDLALAFLEGNTRTTASTTTSTPPPPQQHQSMTESHSLLESIVHPDVEDLEEDEEEGGRLPPSPSSSSPSSPVQQQQQQQQRTAVGEGVGAVGYKHHPRSATDEYVRLVEGGSDHEDDHSESHHPLLLVSTSPPPPPPPPPHLTSTTANTTPAATATATASLSRSTSSLRLPHMRRLHKACVYGNLVSLCGIAALLFGSVRYYPKIPEYNICNDSVAWSSLMNSLKSLSATADFEILASVSNLNHVDIVLDSGSHGTFYHKGVHVGTFDIPPVTAAAVAITDVLIVAHLAPEKWDALSLIAEYYSGSLVLDVDVTANIRIPALFNAQISKTLQNIEVQVNALSDRHLCSCEDWDTTKKKNYSIASSYSSSLSSTASPLSSLSIQR